MKRAIFGLVLVALTPGCGLFGKKSTEKKDQPKFEAPAEPKPVVPIAPDRLASLLPKMDGWHAKPTSAQLVNVGPDQASRATGEYERKIETMTSTVKLEIVDGAYAADVMGPLARMAHGGSQEDPHKLALEIEGQHGVSAWKPETGTVSAALMVARRFLVTLEGKNITPEELKLFLHGANIKTLASWAGTPAAPPKTGTAAH